MKHFGFFAHSATGHLNPMIALAREFRRRGHHVTFFQVADAQAAVAAAGLDFVPIGASDYPLGEIPRLHRIQGELSGLAAFRFTLAKLTRQAEMYLRELPSALRAGKLDGLVADHVLLAAGSAADTLGLPFVSICCGVAYHEDPSIPPFNCGWRWSDSPMARIRNRAAWNLLHRLTAPVRQVVNDYRRDRGLNEFARNEDFLSRLAQVSQQPGILEYPRDRLPECFHFTGPFTDAQARAPVEFPFDLLKAEPLIYASLGTLQNRQLGVFRTVAEACDGLKTQLVISTGGGTDAAALRGLPGSPIAVDYAPQLQLLPRASVAITHGGANTVLESLAHGVPLVAIPITNDQPGMAARVRKAGVGEVLPFGKVTTKALRSMIERVLADRRYRLRAQEVQTAIAGARGLATACDILEAALITGRPVLRAALPVGRAVA